MKAVEHWEQINSSRGDALKIVASEISATFAIEGPKKIRKFSCKSKLM
jgi:hypothetical protein